VSNRIVGGVIAAIIVVVGGAILILSDKPEPVKDKTDKPAAASPHTPPPAATYIALDACELFTEAEAKAILGAAATKGPSTDSTRTNDLKVSNCSYTNNATIVKDIRTITVVVRGPLTETGAKSNKTVFGAGKPVGTETVSGYGTEAYYVKATGQFNILKDDNWIMITSGSPNPIQHTVADAKLVADKILN